MECTVVATPPDTLIFHNWMDRTLPYACPLNMLFTEMFSLNYSLWLLHLLIYLCEFLSSSYVNCIVMWQTNGLSQNVSIMSRLRPEQMLSPFQLCSCFPLVCSKSWFINGLWVLFLWHLQWSLLLLLLLGNWASHYWPTLLFLKMVCKYHRCYWCMITIHPSVLVFLQIWRMFRISVPRIMNPNGYGHRMHIVALGMYFIRSLC